jgi:uncharacterized protein (TIGR03086 family)
MAQNHDTTTTGSVTELIAIGRDREAIDAAVRDSSGEPRGGSMDGAQQLDEIIPMLEHLVDGITPAQLEGTTACAGFTVSGVLGHMFGGATAFAPAFRGEPAPEADPDADAGDITQQWRAAMVELLAAVHSPGAMDRTIASPFGEVPGAMFARYVAFDGLIHGWDLATATGQPYEPRPELLAEVDAFARSLLQPEMRDGDTFAAEAPAPVDATPLERLVAFTGRILPGQERT